MREILIILIKNLIPFILDWISDELSKEKQARKVRKEAIDEISEGIKTKNPTKVTAGFDRISVYHQRNKRM